MSGKDFLKLLLLNYGFREIEISSYRGDYNAIGYEVSAEKIVDDEYIHYHEINCDGLTHHIWCITNFMHKNELEPEITNKCNQSIKDFLNDETRVN